MMKKRRLFTAINLPDEVKRGLAKLQSEWADLSASPAGRPVRPTRRENLHVTLVFLGAVGDEELPALIDSVKKAVAASHSFEVGLSRVCLAPARLNSRSGGPPKRLPRMIWAKGDKNRGFSLLTESLEKELFKAGFCRRNENRGLIEPHVTLARTRQSQRLVEEAGRIEKEISISFPVESVEIMESVLSPKGPEYFILESVPLKED